jgi:DNA-binding GntR family transcriptional regulator
MKQDSAHIAGSIDALEDHHPLGDLVYRRLRDAIIDGRLAAGMWLRQEALAKELGTSQLPVREAIRRLAAEGLAVRIPYKGVRVVEFSPEDIIDMFNVRITLESLAVRYATPMISSQALDDLQKNLDESVHYTEPDQMEKRRKLNTEFHLNICRACNHHYLIRQVEAMWVWFPSTMLYEGMRRQEALSQKRLQRENREHRAILSAIMRRDAQLAEQKTRQHICNLSQELAEVLGISKQLVDAWVP